MSGFPGWCVNRTQLNRDGENGDGENGDGENGDGDNSDHQPAQFRDDALWKSLN
jgi:hypothetical protein